MALIETSPSGVTWGLGFDRTPHVYNGGYGGAVCTGETWQLFLGYIDIHIFRLFHYRTEFSCSI